MVIWSSQQERHLPKRRFAVGVAPCSASAGTNAPVTIDGDYVIAGAAVPSLSKSRHALIIAYKLGATGKLPVTVGS